MERSSITLVLALRMVIGHEMTHGFDDQGAKFDLSGNVKQWWTDEDLAKFKERTECIAKEYDGFQVAPGQNLNGHLTLGENTADNGGIRIAFQALLDTITKDRGPGADYVNGEKDGYTPGTAVLYRLRAGVVLQHHPGIRPDPSQNRSAQQWRVACERDGPEFR
jgi:predicted metalloendopeptidase